MPTVVLMDVSLSMTRPVLLDGSEEFQRKNLAVHGLNMLFEHMASNYRLEFTALMAFSSLWELLVPFTRDYNALQVKCCIKWHPLRSAFTWVFLMFVFVQEALSSLEDYDKTCVESALQGVNNVVQQEWGSACPCQVCWQVLWTETHNIVTPLQLLHVIKAQINFPTVIVTTHS